MTSIYTQTLDLAGDQIKTLADAINPRLITEKKLPQRKLNWDDLKNFAGLVLAWDEKAIEQSDDSTNERDVRGYPCYLLHLTPGRSHLDSRLEDLRKLKQSVRRYYNFKRRMGDVEDTGTNQLQSRVVEDTPAPPREIATQLDVYGLTVIFWYIEPRTT